MNSKYYYIEAVRTWQDVNRKLKHFAECCYHVSNRETRALAEDCGCSVDTIENYRNAWTLYTELGGEKSERFGFLWDTASISLWVKAAQMRRKLEIPLERTADYLETAIKEDMTRDQFAAVVDEKENKTPKWARALQSVAAKLSTIEARWVTSMPDDKRERYHKAVRDFQAALEEIAGEVKAV